MNLKKILCGVMLIPALVVTGCKKDDGDKDKLEYTEVDQAETVAFLSQMVEEEKMTINSYNFNITVALPNMEEELGVLSEEGEGEEQEEEFAWPDASDLAGWNKVQMSGAIELNEESFKASYSMTDPVSAETYQIYIENTTIYANTPEGKYKITLATEEEILEGEFGSSLPTNDSFLEQINLICVSESGLKFEKAEKDSKTYYHISGVATTTGDFSFELPIDITLVFEDGELVSYKYKTFMLFVYMEVEVNASSDTIDFPADLNTYVTNDDFFISEEPEELV